MSEEESSIEVGQSTKRIFSEKQKKECWDKAETVPGRDPERWRKDAAGNIVCRALKNCMGCTCYDFDHIVPFSKGGETVVSNCQILQTRVNRLKGNRTDVDVDSMKRFSCATQFSEREMDLLEMGVFGNVNRDDLKFRIKSVQELDDQPSKNRNKRNSRN